MFLILMVAVVFAAIYYYLQAITFWKRQGVPQGSLKFNISNLTNLFCPKISLAERNQLVYNLVSQSRYTGFYQMTLKILMIKDPDLLKDITVKSFDHFPDHTNVFPEGAEPLWAKNLFVLKGQKWRDMRPILSPSFTSSKMRSMFVLISECAEKFSKYFLKQEDKIIEVELKDIFSRFANDVIATTAFGIEVNSLEHKDNQFYKMGKQLDPFIASIFNMVKFILLVMFPNVALVSK